MLTVHDYVMATRTDFEEANLFFGHGTDNALDDFNTALKLDSRYAEAWTNQALVFESRGNKKRAFKSYSRAVALKPEQLIALAETFNMTIDELLGRSTSKRAKGPAGKALKTFERVAQLPRRQQERVLAMVEDMLIAHEAKKAS